MLLKAKEKWDIDFDKSWMIGDSESDIICGRSSGCKTIRILHNNEDTEADFVTKSLFECVDIIKNENR
jgi:D-glycero-D-manno-heptose 1,7-bisphosphate phosphatase